VIAHVVLFTPKHDLSIADKRLFAQSVLSVTTAVAAIERASVGRRIDVDAGYSRSLGDEPYEYAAVLEFRDRAALVAYLRHPRHLELGALFWKCCEKTVVSEVEYVDSGSDLAVDWLTESR